MNPERALASITDLIVRCVDPDAIVLFGSVAQGRPRSDSDIDLMVVASFREPRQRRGLELRGLYERYAMPVDLQLYTREEFDAEALDPYSFATMVGRHGITLYARPGSEALAGTKRKGTQRVHAGGPFR